MEEFNIKSKKIMMMSLLILACCLFLISSVSAADINVNGTTFADISDAINIANDGDNIYLNGQIYYGDGKQIEISKNNLVIFGGSGANGTWDGNHSTLDAQYLSRIFFITAGNNCTIYGVNFMNGNSTATEGGMIGMGGAIFTEIIDYLYIEDCVFSSNIVSDYGGALYSNANFTYIDSSLFRWNENTNKRGGAVVLNGLKGAIFNTDFYHNYADSYGGALYLPKSSYEAVLICNCKFEDNTAGVDAAAIFSYQTIYMSNNVFDSNRLTDENGVNGGAVYLASSNNVISDCVFTENKASINGGALYLEGNNNIIKNSVFERNLAEDENTSEPTSAGALFIIGYNNTVDSCNFTNNMAMCGGAICIYNATEAYLKNNFFSGNSAETGNDIYNYGKVYLENNECTSEESTLFNQGTILSETIIVINENKTIVVQEGETIQLQAVVMADGFIVESKNLDFVLDDGTILTAEYQNGIYVANYNATIDTTVNVTYEGSVNKTIKTAKIIISEFRLDTADLIKIVGTPDKFVAFLSYRNGTPISGENITFTVLGKTYTRTTDEKGMVTLNINLGIGTYDIKTTYGDLTRYNTITVSPHIVSQDIVKVYKNNTQYTVLVLNDDLSPKANAKVDISIFDKTYTKITDEKGIATLNINLAPGEYTVTSTYNGEKITNTITVIWGQLYTEDMYKYVKTPTQYVATVTDFNGNPTSGVNVEFTIMGKTYTRTTDENGEAKLNINLGPGSYNITTTYGNQSATNFVDVLVANLTTSDLVKYYKDTTPFTATLIGDHILEGAEISFTICGKTYTRYTNADGIASLNINLGPGIYDITTQYYNQTFTNTVTVLNGDIVTQDLIKYYKDASAFEAKIVNGDNLPIEGVTVEFTILGKTYTRITDENGIAKLNINVGVGTYTIKTVCGPSEKVNNITVLTADLKTSDLTKYCKNDSQFTATITDKDQPVAGVEVTFIILGKTYTRTTDENGIATLNINLGKGTYQIVTQYADKTATNNITVLPTILINDTTVTYKDGGKVKATFLDGQGHILVNTTVSFTITGKTYTRTTDENGTASITINLNPGTYTIGASYNGITENAKLTVNKREADLKIENSTVKQNEKITLYVTDTKTKEPVQGVIIYYMVFYKEDQDPIVAAQYTNEKGMSQATIGLPIGTYQAYIGIQQDPFYSNKLLWTQIKVI